MSKKYIILAVLILSTAWMLVYWAIKGSRSHIIITKTTYEAFKLTPEEVDRYKALAGSDAEAANRLYQYYLFVEEDEEQAKKWEKYIHPKTQNHEHQK